MHALEEALAAWPSGAVGTVLHIGAGSGAVLRLYAQLQPAQALLVEGDPRHGDALRAAAAGMPTVEVLVRAVSPAGGALNWCRHSLPGLDGPQDMQALRLYYPRLRLLEQFPQASVPVAEIIAGAPQGATGMALLVLDLPGQEDALLAAMGAQVLNAFDAVLLCGCNGVPGVQAAAQAVQRLQGGGAQLSWSNAQCEPLWPLHVLKTPRGMARERGLPADGGAGAAQLARQAQELRALRAQIVALQDELAQARLAVVPASEAVVAAAELEPLRRESAGLRAELAAARAAQASELAGLRAAQAQERQRHDALQQQLADAEAQIGLLKELLLREAPT